ncbi:MAG: hypothetical protein ACRECO_07680 [Xanthobacteraceae bacterium]
MTERSPLTAIPIVDVGEGGARDYALSRREHARALRDDCFGWMPGGVRRLMPVIDGVTRRWLARSCSPYVVEIETIAAAFGYSGIWFLNGCYQWGCTSLAREQDGAPWLARTLDWPFPGLGRRLEIARMRGAAGEFYNVGWPGYVGILTAVAPGRFAAAINQAPMWRRTRRPWLRPYDLARNAMRTWCIRFIPPDHLLRDVFETCPSFDQARHRIETTPIARPAIYTLVGCKPGERCVIERTEEDFTTRVEHTAAANDWMRSAPPWEARVRADLMFTRSYQDCAANSRTRRELAAAWTGRLQGRFDWVQPPVLNPYTRLAVEMCPATGALHAIGFENVGGAELPQPATIACTLPAVL